MKKKILLIILCGALVLAGCNPPQSGPQEVADLGLGGEPQAWIDAPLNESRLPLARYEIVFHITDAHQVTAGELRINDRVVATMNNPDPADKLVTLTYLWDPEAPGSPPCSYNNVPPLLPRAEAPGASGCCPQPVQRVLRREHPHRTVRRFQQSSDYPLIRSADQWKGTKGHTQWHAQ